MFLTNAKKILAVLLCAVMLFSLPANAIAVELNSYPVIYVGDMSENALYENPNKNSAVAVFDMSSSEFTSGISSVVMGVFLGALVDSATGLSPVLTGVQTLMDKILCAENGQSKNSSVGPWYYGDSLGANSLEGIYSDDLKAFVNAASGYITDNEMFFFSYDWRIDPMENAQKLRDYIDHVELVTNSKKVSVVSVGYGGTVVNTYLHEHEAHSIENLASCVFYNTALLGNAIIGDFMKGRIVKLFAEGESFGDKIDIIQGTDRGEAFFNFLSDDSLELVSGIAENILGKGSLVTLVTNLALMLGITIAESQDLHKTLGKSYNTFALNADNKVYDTYLRDALRNMPGLWALVPQDSFDEAIDFMFMDEIINPQLQSKIMDYRSVIDDTAITLRNAQINGINVNVVANYGLQLLPVTISINDLSDGIESVKYASAGAVTNDNRTAENHILRCEKVTHNHVSNDTEENCIHAEYCALPENTWFIENLGHGSMTENGVADFLVWLTFSLSQRSVRENKDYPQFMVFDEYSNKLKSDTTPGDEYSSVKYGDIDGDGNINAMDARLALRASVNLEALTKEQKVVADVTADGKIGADDAREILRYSVGLVRYFDAQ